MATKRKVPASAAKRAKKADSRGAVFSEGLVLSPQTEMPRHPRGQDRSSRSTTVEELSWSRFDSLIHALAREVHEGSSPHAVVGLAHGGVFVGGALAGALGIDFFPVRLSRRSRDTHARGKDKLLAELPRELKGKRVLVVDDVVSSGDTLQLAVALLEKIGAANIQTACLVRREGGYQADYTALTTDGVVVFPWDYAAVTEDVRFDASPSRRR